MSTVDHLNMMPYEADDVNVSGLQSYVLVYGIDGTVFKQNEKAVVVQAKSKDDAANIFCKEHGFGGGDWDIRLAGDEPRIEAIERYAGLHYQIGRIDKEIAGLNEKRHALLEDIDALRGKVYALPYSTPPYRIPPIGF